MNSGQTAVATLGGAVAAESLIGGIGLAIGGTAVGIPAAAVVLTVGGVATAAKLLEEKMPKLRAWSATKRTAYWLKKDDVVILFGVNPGSQIGDYRVRYRNGVMTNDVPTYRFVSVLREVYKDYLSQGFKPVDKP